MSMKPFLSVSLLLCIPILAYGAAGLLNHCILLGYKKSPSELEFPSRLLDSHTRRTYLFTGCLLSYCIAWWLAASWITFAVYLFYMSILTAVVVMDFEQQLILNRFILSLTILALLATPVLPAAFLPRILAGGAGFLIFLCLAMITRGGIGGGDIKLIGALGLFLGPDRLLFTIIIGVVAGGLVSLCLLLTRKKKRTDMIAYGPYFAIAAAFSLFL
ncbi:hypothetical protein BSR42_09040 [Megasphaera cerevisiae]|nr:hypothetical protein BSR42_09040 [Megasphaera cerevisiae]